MLRLTTIGRHTRAERSVIIAYLEDGPNLIGLAMNGWADADPAWWLNLQAHPEATVQLPTGPRPPGQPGNTPTPRERTRSPHLCNTLYRGNTWIPAGGDSRQRISATDGYP